MSRTKTFLIRLIPQGTFFFGNERSFSPSEDEDNYFVKSSYFPQQTALLGLLRYLVLQKAGQLDKPATQTSVLIGNTGFPNPNGYKKIKSLSPLFIRCDKSGEPAKSYIAQAKDWAYDDARKPIRIFLQEQSGNAKAASALDSNFLMEGYKAKNELARLLTEAGGREWKEMDWDKDKDTDSVEPTNGIFAALEKVGIKKTHAFDEQGNKGNRGAEEEDGFYRQRLFRLLPHYSFAFFASLEVDDNGTPPIAEGLTVFGGEKSSFMVRITEAGDDAPQEQFSSIFSKAFQDTAEPRRSQIILTSDACISPELFDCCDFSINAQIDFRHIITPANVAGKAAYSSMKYKRETDSPYKSDKYNLVERGSVFYIKNGQMDNAKAALKNDAYEAIGYNHFIAYAP